MRLKKPTRAIIDQVRITREGNDAIIDYADAGIAGTRIRLTHDIMARFNNDAGEGFMPMPEAIKALGVSRQTVLQRVKRGELDAVHVMRGKAKRTPNQSGNPATRTLRSNLMNRGAI